MSQGHDFAQPQGMRMRVLQLLRDGPEPTADRIIALHAREHEVKVVDLRTDEISYATLVDEIFAYDKVICW